VPDQLNDSPEDRETSHASPRAGEIWLVDFSPQVGREQSGLRPALVVSSDQFNAVPNDLFIVCPLTTRDRGLDSHIKMGPIEGMLRQTSFVMCDQVKSQDIRRFRRRHGIAPDDVLERVLYFIRMFFSTNVSNPKDGTAADVC